ncbi:MAG: 4-alpha-glucanotransferase [bacterium]|nr:4-alpha-glucanotransferase [bacterium]
MNHIGAELEELARRYGVALDYEEIGGERREATAADLRAVLGAMGVDVRDEAACRRSLHASERERTRSLDPVIVVSCARDFPLQVQARIPAHEDPSGWAYELGLEGEVTLCERIRDADWLQARSEFVFEELTYVCRNFVIETAPPPGYHRLRIYREDSLQENGDDSECLLICHPDDCFPAPAGRALALQLYALRSGQNCGSGEFADLAALGPWLKREGFGVAAVSPVHAGYPANPRHASPYSPSNRRFTNLACVAPRLAPEWNEEEPAAPGLPAAAVAPVDHVGPGIDYAAAQTRRMALLEKLFARFQQRDIDRDSKRAREFRRYCKDRGEGLRRQALFDALYEYFFREHEPPLYGWRQWPAPYRHPEGPAVAAFARMREERIAFYQYAYWLADSQREATRRSLLEHGIQLNLDLAVGADQGGAETWIDREVYALHASAGAPPDPFAPGGQNWGLAPMIPHRLRARAYWPFIELLRANLPEDGIVRIDHVVQLFRLYWAAPNDCGAYVYYPFGDLLGILCLESRRRRCAIIGEDLGTVPENVRSELAARDILSWRVMYFEKDGEDFIPPEDYSEASIASANTHDLPTLRGYWNAADIRLRENLGALSTLEAGRARNERDRDRRALLSALVERDLIASHQADAYMKQYSPDLRDALHRLLECASSRLHLYSLHDLLDEAAQPNLPGTVHEYPNWELSYSRSLQEIQEIQRLRGESSD